MRGIQETDLAGQVTFSTIYPGWYVGRTVHIHVEIYSDLDSAPIKTTQLAFPIATSKVVVAQTAKGYTGATGLIDNSADNVFSDGVTGQMLAVAGTTSGYVSTISLGIKV